MKDDTAQKPDPDLPPSEPARAKPLPRRLPLSGAPPDLVPARMVNEVLYCERLLYLEWAQSEFADNAFTVEGRAVHKRADEARGNLPPPKRATKNREQDEESVETLLEDRPYEARSLWLSSDKLGITAKIDVVEGDAKGRVVPIEYKRGTAPDVPGGAYVPERAQICAQALILREHGYSCDEGAIYFAASHKRVPIPIDDRLIETTLRAVARARELTAVAEPPPPLEDSPKCWGCSLSGICLPDETNLLKQLQGEEIPDEPEPYDPILDDLTGPVEQDPWDLVGPQPEPPVALRRLQAARDDRVPLYVQEAGARITLGGGRLVVQSRNSPTVEARLANTSQVVLYGNVQITTQALRALLERRIPLSFLSHGGWFYGRATGLESKNVELRVAQHHAAADSAFCLRLARQFVATKVRNSRTLLRRNHTAADPVALSELVQLARKAEQAQRLDALLGIEGTAARVYFGQFTGMFKGDAARGDFDLEGRNRRPPRDPINALLSFVYSLLSKDFAQTLATVGLDPLLGFYHQPRFGRPALALDLMEEFRPLVGDSTVIGALNNGVVTADDFVVRSSGVALKAPGRKKFILAYERRMDQLVTHPLFGYRISYRRVLEVQARLLGRLLLGEIDDYPAFRRR